MRRYIKEKHPEACKRPPARKAVAPPARSPGSRGGGGGGGGGPETTRAPEAGEARASASDGRGVVHIAREPTTRNVPIPPAGGVADREFDTELGRELAEASRALEDKKRKRKDDKDSRKKEKEEKKRWGGAS